MPLTPSEIKQKWRKSREDRDRHTSGTQWGDYNLRFNDFGNKNIKELQKFIIALDSCSRWAVTLDDVKRDITKGWFNEETNRFKGGNAISAEFRNQYISPSENIDVILLQDSASVKQQLKKPYMKPLLYRMSDVSPSLISRPWSIQEFWEYLTINPRRPITVYDYSMDEGRTQFRTVEEARQHWQIPVDERPAWNLLDIENRTPDFSPPCITELDLSSLVSHYTTSTWGRTWKEFLIFSEKNSISPIHIDNSGQHTVILILEGRKIWYFPRNLDMESVLWFSEAGTQYPHRYRGGWARVELRAGDFMIMPPSCPYAVFTPEDCLMVGSHFFTAAHLPRSLHGLRLQEDNNTISNEDITNKIYETLAKVLNHLQSDQISTEEDRAAVVGSSRYFLYTASRQAAGEINPRKRAKLTDSTRSKKRKAVNSRDMRLVFIQSLRNFKETVLREWDLLES